MRALNRIAGAALALGAAASVAPATAQPAIGGREAAARLGGETRVLISDWAAGFPKDLWWRRDHVNHAPGYAIGLRVSEAAPGAQRPLHGGEYQTRDFRTVWGRAEWRAKLPKAPSGCVAAMFLYHDPWHLPTVREFDFEYVAGDPKSDSPYGAMHMTVHMKRLDGSGRREYIGHRHEMDATCVDGACDWAIEVQPGVAHFETRVAADEPWRRLASFQHGVGWTERRDADFSSPEVWSDAHLRAWTSYWCSDQHASWIGPLDRAALRAGADPFVIEEMRFERFEDLPEIPAEMWRATSDGMIEVTALPESRLTPTDLDIRVGDGPWTRLGPAEPGSYPAPDALPRGATLSLRLAARSPVAAISEHQVTGPASATSDRVE